MKLGDGKLFSVFHFTILKRQMSEFAKEYVLLGQKLDQWAPTFNVAFGRPLFRKDVPIVATGNTSHFSGRSAALRWMHLNPQIHVFTWCERFILHGAFHVAAVAAVPLHERTLCGGVKGRYSIRTMSNVLLDPSLTWRLLRPSFDTNEWARRKVSPLGINPTFEA